MISKILIGYAMGVFGIFVLATVVVMVGEAFQRGGWPAAVLTGMIMAAFPAFMVGSWLRFK
jgi:hypothetical protein